MDNSMKFKLRALLDMDCCDETLCENARRFGLCGNLVDNETAMLAGLLAAASGGSIPAVREVRSILGADDSAERLALKKQELDLKKQGAMPDNSLINSWLEAVTDDDSRCAYD